MLKGMKKMNRIFAVVSNGSYAILGTLHYLILSWWREIFDLTPKGANSAQKGADLTPKTGIEFAIGKTGFSKI